MLHHSQDTHAVLAACSSKADRQGLTMTAIQVALAKVKSARSRDNVQACMQVWHPFPIAVTLGFDTQGKQGKYPHVTAL